MKQATVLFGSFLLTLSTSFGEIVDIKTLMMITVDLPPNSDQWVMNGKWKTSNTTPERLELRALQKRTLALQPGKETNKLIKVQEDEKFSAALPGVLKQF